MTAATEWPWRTSTVGAQFEIQLGKMLDAARNFGEPKRYVGNRAVQWGRIDLSTAGVVPLTPRDQARFRLKRNDLLVCEGGEVGRAAIWREQLHECYYQKALHRLRPKSSYDPRVMLALLEYWSSTNGFINFVTQTSIAHLPRDKFLTMPLPLIPETEQGRLADVLDDLNSLISALERMIAKKQAIKHGMMQQLLTGKTRLASFTDQWREHRLDDISEKIQDGTHFSPAPGGTEFKYITSKNIGSGRLKLDFVETISKEEHRKIFQRCDTRFGDLLLTKDGANTGNVAINTFREEISLLSSIAFIRANHQLAQESYILQYFLSDAGHRQIRDAMSGNAITRLTLQKIRGLRITLPSVEEQTAVARALGDVDAKIDGLCARLTKAKSVKYGLMQELLTGRTRLPVEESAA